MLWQLAKSLTASVARAIWRDPEVRKLQQRHPRLAAFIRQRLTPDQEFGLHLTVGVIFTAFFIYLFFGIVQDLIGFDPLVQADLRIINLLQILRGGVWNSTMLFFTYLGKAQIVFAGAALLVMVLYLRRAWHYIVALLVSLLGAEAFVWLIKNIVERPRPPLTHALMPESGYSFPSGHSFVALAFYGLVFYFWWRVTRGFWKRAAIFILGLVLIAAIGFSRIYLGVHWPSDVLASYASGSGWLTAIITALEINHKFFRRGEGKPLISRRQAAAAGAVFFVIWLAFVWIYFARHPLPAAGQVPTDQMLVIAAADIPDRLFTFLPRQTEGVAGKTIEPVNVIFVASPAGLKEAFAKAGWDVADQVSLHSLWRLAKAAIWHRPYSQAPGIPTFWDTRPYDFAFEQPTPADSVAERHHLHIWQTPYRLLDGRGVWMGTAHFDTAITLRSSLVIPTHSIDPAVDKERDKIRGDLLSTGLVQTMSVYQMVEPTLGKNISGGEFFTDGKADVLWLR